MSLCAFCVPRLEPIKTANPALTYGDLYTLASALALKSTGGPSVAWRAGRIDAGPANTTSNVPAGTLPDASAGVSGTQLNSATAAAAIRSKFGRMGFTTDTEMVALIGAHTLGKAHGAVTSGFYGPWTPRPNTWSNDFFVDMLKPWTAALNPSNLLQFQRPRETPSLVNQMRLPSDIVLKNDAAFLAIVNTYAAPTTGNQAFNRDFQTAFAKLLELGQRGNLFSVPITF